MRAYGVHRYKVEGSHYDGSLHINAAILSNAIFDMALSYTTFNGTHCDGYLT
jgi:hypothetical protein